MDLIVSKKKTSKKIMNQNKKDIKLNILKNYFEISNKNILTKVKTYVYVICHDVSKQIKNIQNTHKIKSIPKTFLKTPESDDIRTLYLDNSQIIFYIIGKTQRCDVQHLYYSYGIIGKMISDLENVGKYVIVNLNDQKEDSLLLRNSIISYILGFYRFTDLKTNFLIEKLPKTFFYTSKTKNKIIIKSAIEEALIQNEVRSLVNLPANILNTETYSKYIQKNIPSNLKCKIMNEKQLRILGFNLILAVNAGSKYEAKMIILEYNSNKLSGKKEKRSEKSSDKGPIVIIGKGVMFDSGGYTIKFGDMSDMKYDMTGSAIVYGLMKMIAESKIDGHFVALLPLVENMIDSKSIRPGDIVKSYSGKTVEIIDTDAEGRLIIADALAYSTKWKPSLCIDIATLTGQAVTLFDGKSSVLVGTNNTLNQKLIQSGMVNQEKIWELPMWENYLQYTKSEIADYKSYSYESKGQILSAAAFIYNFVPKDSDWIHLDIAGVEEVRYDQETRHKGASGETLRTLFTFLTHLKKPIYVNK